MRCRNYFSILCLAAVFVMLVCSPSLARSIPGAPNEVHDPYFENPDLEWYVDQQLQPYDPVNTLYPTIAPNPEGMPGGYLDPGRSPGDKVFVRTIVDDYEGLWNPDYNKKEIDFSLYAHIAGDGYVKVRFDWWDDPTIPRPSNDPNDPTSPTPDGWTDWYVITADGSNSFLNIPPFPEENPGWFIEDLWSYHDIWDHQPRWVSIEIEAGISLGGQLGGEALITGIDFEARCVPEPSTLILLCMGIVGLLLARRK